MTAITTYTDNHDLTTFQQVAITELAPNGILESMYAERLIRLMWRLESLRRQEEAYVSKPKRVYEMAKKATKDRVNQALREWWELLSEYDLKRLVPYISSTETAANFLAKDVIELEKNYKRNKRESETVKILYEVKDSPDDAPVDGKKAVFAIEAACLAHELRYGEASIEGNLYFVPNEEQRYASLEAMASSRWTAGRVKRFVKHAISASEDMEEYLDDDYDDPEPVDLWYEFFSISYHQVFLSTLSRVSEAIKRKRDEFTRLENSQLAKLKERADSAFTLADVIGQAEAFNHYRAERAVLADISEARTQLESLKVKREPTASTMSLPTITITPMPQSGVNDNV